MAGAAGGAAGLGAISDMAPSPLMAGAMLDMGASPFIMEGAAGAGAGLAGALASGAGTGAGVGAAGAFPSSLVAGAASFSTPSLALSRTFLMTSPIKKPPVSTPCRTCKPTTNARIRNSRKVKKPAQPEDSSYCWTGRAERRGPGAIGTERLVAYLDATGAVAARGPGWVPGPWARHG